AGLFLCPSGANAAGWPNPKLIHWINSSRIVLLRTTFQRAQLMLGFFYVRPERVLYDNGRDVDRQRSIFMYLYS
ncbi:MAG: hypothetical protein ACI82Q_001291, partial [Nonlabens sp.]